jgi:hypothetical protein
MTDIKRVFTVNGAAVFPIGGQACNSSGYNDAESAVAFRAIELIGGNTLEIPVYWEQVESEEGRFDFSPVDSLIARARQQGIRLVLLWFGTWKNGDMDYAPAWVKSNPDRFHRVTSPTGKRVWVLSSHCAANFEADRAAFVALCQHLAAVDGAQRTVIAVQVENEPGILGSDRDYGPDGQADFDATVPATLMKAMVAAGQGRVYELWQQAGCRAAGTWQEVFGHAAGELLTAWSIATYIDGIVAAGKAAYDIPMYVNVWLGEHGWMIPGETYPSGGAVNKTLDIYKWAGPHIDLIAPDIYVPDSGGYEAECAAYARDDNPLFIPESGYGSNAWNMFRALVEYNSIGYAFFGIESIVAEGGSLRPDARQLADSFCCAAAAIPLLLRYQGTGKLYAVVQEEHMDSQQLPLDGWQGLAAFGNGPRDWTRRDWRHSQLGLADRAETGERGRGLIAQAGPNEFYCVGASYRLVLRPRLSPAQVADLSVAKDHLLVRQAPYISVDEGHFSPDGSYVIDRRRNGDEVDGGVWVEPDCGVVRAIMCDAV